jgi:hypothetical protein
MTGQMRKNVDDMSGMASGGSARRRGVRQAAVARGEARLGAVAGNRHDIRDRRAADIYKTAEQGAVFQGVDVVRRSPWEIGQLVVKIREMREAEPLVSQAEMGRRLGVTGAYVSHLMRKNGMPGRAVYGGTGAVPVGMSVTDRLARLDAWETEQGRAPGTGAGTGDRA